MVHILRDIKILLIPSTNTEIRSLLWTRYIWSI